MHKAILITSATVALFFSAAAAQAFTNPSAGPVWPSQGGKYAKVCPDSGCFFAPVSKQERS